MPVNPDPLIALDTKFGTFVVRLCERQAPVSARNFIVRVDTGLFTGSTIYRIVNLSNQSSATTAHIEVVQFGFPSLSSRPNDLPPISHETTETTGLRHIDGTLSMARQAVGTAGSAFFICIGDQPELDYGGRRNPDGQGFAAFGQVVEGMDIVRKIFSHGGKEQQLSDPIPISAVRL